MSVLGIDIGGSGIKGAPVDIKTGEMLESRYRIATPYPGDPEQVIEVIQRIIEHFDWDGKIGAGFPGVVTGGIIRTAANLSPKWIGVDLAHLIEETSDCPTRVFNDADVAGLAEMRFGIGKKYEDDFVLFLTIGTGIGSAFFARGVLWPNAELGHLEVDGDEAEHHAADVVRQENDLSWKKWGKKLRKVLQAYDALFYPDVMIIGGGVSKKFDKFGKYLKGVEAKILPAALQNQAGIIGAAMAAEESILD
jgi:polyphosphate glucokinase